MDDNISKRPAGVAFNSLSEEVFGIIEKYTAFPWAILASQAKRCNADPASLAAADLKKLIDPISQSVGRYTTPLKRDAVKDELTRLARMVGSP